ncbi:hypothetical protein VPH35_054698 [Triticum aestivum]
MEADALLEKIRVLEEGQAELKREIGKLTTDRRDADAGRRAFRALPPQPQPRRVVARSGGGLASRHCHWKWVLQSLGQAVHVIGTDDKFLYWNRYAEHLFGYSASEAVGQNAVELIVHPTDYNSAKIVIQTIFTGKCWRGKFPVKNKSGDRFFILGQNTLLYDDDGSLVGLIGISHDLRTLEEICSPSGSAESYPSTARLKFHANNQPKSGSLNKGSLQSSTTSKIVTLVTSVTSRVCSRTRTCQDSDKQYGSGSEGQYSELDLQDELVSSEENTAGGDVMHRAFVAEEKSPGELYKTISDDSGEGKVGFHKILNSKAEALLAKMGISWPWKGHEIHGGSGNNNVNSIQLHDKPENDQTFQRVPVLEPIIIPGCQDSEYNRACKYEVSGSWWDCNKDCASSMSSTWSTNSSSIDYEADYLDYEVFWEDLVIGEQVGQG